MNSSDSCLVQKLSHYTRLDPGSLEHLARLERDERTYPKGVTVQRVGCAADDLCVVKHGWLYSHVLLADGRRQIVQIHLPGDVVGFPGIAFTRAVTTLQTAEDACLCPFPKQALDQVFETAPRLAALLFTLAVRDQVILTDLLRAMGRMNARERIAYLLLDLLARLRITHRSTGTTLRLPLNQSEIGDTLGLTNVYVSRSLIALEDDGLIRRHKGDIEIVDERRLGALCEFTDRYDQLDTSWFPARACSLQPAFPTPGQKE